MRILLTNDDGIHAPGLEILERIARQLSDDIWVVAPASEQSGASRGLTLHDPLRVRTIAPQRFAVEGTPTDCVLLAVEDLMHGQRPDLVLSGVNRGQNIAEDVTFSGTVAAALQAMEYGIPAIALSQAKDFRKGHAIPWETAQTHAPALVKAILKEGIAPGTIMNVNFPDLPPDEVTGVEVTRQGFRDERIQKVEKREDLRGGAYFWIGYDGRLSNPPAGTDLRAIYEGRISITPIHIDLTAHEHLQRFAHLTTSTQPVET